MFARIPSLVAGLVAAFFAFGAAAQTLTVVGGNAFPPLMYDDGGPRGYAIEIAKAILADAGFAPKVETYPWPRAQRVALEEGAVITGFSFNEERAKLYHYTQVAFKDPVVVVAARLGELEGFFRRCVIKGQRDGSIAASPSARDLARLLLTTVMGLRVLSRVRPEPALLRGTIRQVLALLGPPSSEEPT